MANANDTINTVGVSTYLNAKCDGLMQKRPVPCAVCGCGEKRKICMRRTSAYPAGPGDATGSRRAKWSGLLSEDSPLCPALCPPLCHTGAIITDDRTMNHKVSQSAPDALAANIIAQCALDFCYSFYSITFPPFQPSVRPQKGLEFTSRRTVPRPSL